MARTLVFDPYDTLLDLSALDPYFQRSFGTREARHEWWMALLQAALVDSLTGSFRDLPALADAALEVVAARRGIVLGEHKQEILSALTRLPPHKDARASLQKLRDSGFRLAALSNERRELAEAQLAHAGLLDFFDTVISAAEANRMKPAAEPYRFAAERLGQPPEELRLVVAEGWDARGALSSGCQAALLERHGMVPDPGGERPDIVASDLETLAERIVEVEMGPSFPG